MYTDFGMARDVTDQRYSIMSSDAKLPVRWTAPVTLN